MAERVRIEVEFKLVTLVEGVGLLELASRKVERDMLDR